MAFSVFISIFMSGICFCYRMFQDRTPHMLDNDYTPHSALNIFVKDLVRLTCLILFFFFFYQNEKILWSHCLAVVTMVIFVHRALFLMNAHPIKFHSCFLLLHTNFSCQVFLTG